MFGFFKNPLADEGRKLVEQGATLLDVRTPAEFGRGHVAGAKNIPVNEVPHRLSEVGPKHKPVVLYCRSGARRATAAQILQQAGFEHVLDIGPMPRW